MAIVIGVKICTYCWIYHLDFVFLAVLFVFFVYFYLIPDHGRSDNKQLRLTSFK